MSNEWCPEQVLQKVIGKMNTETLTKPALKYHHYEEDEYIPLSAWEDALVKTAFLVERYGPKYVPFFERVEQEIKSSKNRMQTMEKIRHVVSASRIMHTERYFLQP